MQAHTNRMIDGSSLYLLLHAHNPADWFPSGMGVSETAKKGGKPVLLIINDGASCWCQMKEWESFKNPIVAAFMNQYFLNIEVNADSPLFFCIQKAQADVLLKKRSSCCALPFASSVIASNLYCLSTIFDKKVWCEKTEVKLTSDDLVAKYPTLLSVCSSLLLEITYRNNEFAINGSDFYERLDEVLSPYFPYFIIISSESETGFFLLRTKESNGRTLTYLCKNYARRKPIEPVSKLETPASFNFLRKNTIIV